MAKWVFIACGGALGTLLRYFLSGLDYRFSQGFFPMSTLVINLAGSLFIGFFWGLFERMSVSPEMRMFVFIGILGGFTTFSTFTLENFNLMRDGELRIALVNILASNLLGIACVFLGFWVGRGMLNSLKGVG